MARPLASARRVQEYNLTYLRKLRVLTKRASTYGFYTVLDGHQDSFSEYFCGEGMPDWARKRDGSRSMFCAWPSPVGKPITDYYMEPKLGGEGLHASAVGAEECVQVRWHPPQPLDATCCLLTPKGVQREWHPRRPTAKAAAATRSCIGWWRDEQYTRL